MTAPNPTISDEEVLALIAELPMAKPDGSDLLYWSRAAYREARQCSRCREHLAVDEVPLELHPEAGGEALWAFCTRCARDPDSKRCRACGCSDNYPCEEGCFWMEERLCSSIGCGL